MDAAAVCSTAGDALRDAVARLADAGVPEPRADAEVLLAHALGTDRAGVVVAARRPLPPDAAARWETVLGRRCAREPVAYITGAREFWSLPIAVDPRVLIPRPETELVVEVACRLAPGARRILDAGTGSGALAAALGRELPSARVVASDREAGAVAVAAGNLARLAPAAAVVRADWLGAFRPASFDLVVANPPYLTDDEPERLEPEVGRWEPRTALAAGPDGLDCLRILVRQAPAVLVSGGWVVLEMGMGQAAAVGAAVRADGRYGRVVVARDYAGVERVLAAECRTAEGAGTWTSS